jgi:hypothetical protein
MHEKQKANTRIVSRRLSVSPNASDNGETNVRKHCIWRWKGPLTSGAWLMSAYREFCEIFTLVSSPSKRVVLRSGRGE